MLAACDFPTNLRNKERKGSLSDSDCNTDSFLVNEHKRPAYTLCLFVHEGKPAAILKDQKLFLMGNIESAELKTQLCGSNGNVIAPVSQRALSAHCVQGVGSAGRGKEVTAQRVFLNDITCL